MSEHPGPYKRSLPILSVSGTMYQIEGPSPISGIYNKARAKTLVHMLNSAWHAGEAERAELIRQRDEAEERTKLVLEQVTIIINAFAAKMKKVNAESGVDFSQLEAIAANPRFTEKAREIAAKALSTLPSPPNR